VLVKTDFGSSHHVWYVEKSWSLQYAASSTAMIGSFGSSSIFRRSRSIAGSAHE
jgi:hypothetical protein